MTPQTLMTKDDYNAVPVGTVVIDSRGYVWQKVEARTRLAEGSESVWFGTNQAPMHPHPPQNDDDMVDVGCCTVIHPPQGDPGNL